MFPEDYNEEILNFLDKWREDIVKVGQVLGGKPRYNWEMFGISSRRHSDITIFGI